MSWKSLALRARGDTRPGSIRLESLAVLLLLAIAASLLSPYFLSVANFLNILLATSVIGIVALGMTFVICMGEIDLSVGSVVALSAVSGVSMVKPLGLPWPSVILVSLAVGAFVGLINGLLVARARIPSFIVTLGTLGIARGLAYILTTERAIYGLPDPLIFLGQGRVFGIPLPIVVFTLFAAVAHVVLRHTRFGRHTLFIGDNALAPRVTGLDVGRHRVLVFVLSGTMAAAAGIVQTGRLNAADPSGGAFFELSAITAAIIGGTNLYGGRGTIVGTVVGAIIMGVIQNALNLLGVEAFYQPVVIGVVLIVAVWLDRLRSQIAET